MGMTFTIWGARGTFPAPGPDFARYGGHTTCASLRVSPSSWIVIDAGTGLSDLGRRIMAEAQDEVRVDLFLSHFHLDHVIGLPFFGPLFSERAKITVHAPAPAAETRSILGGLMGGRLFPVPLDRTPARKEFRELEAGTVVGGVRITSCPLRHPQGSVGFRLEAEGSTIVLANDTEHPERGIDDRLVAFAGGATWFVYDAMYTPEEYAAGKTGWGHSTWLAGTELAEAAGAGTLVLAHFNPAHTDADLDLILTQARRRRGSTTAAQQGLEMRLGKD